MEPGEHLGDSGIGRAVGFDDAVVPNAMAPGNHDYGPSGNASTRQTLLNDFFLFDDDSARPNFGGAMIDGQLDNTYHFFQAGGYDFIVLCLERGPRDSTMAGADSILAQHPNKKAILVTHAFMNNNDLRYDHRDAVNPQATPFAPAGPPVEWKLPSSGGTLCMRVGAKNTAD